MPSISIDRELCKGCETCMKVCPQKVIGMSGELNVKGEFHALLDQPSRCIGCRTCAISCPDVAIEVAVNGVQYNFFEY